MTDEHRYSLLNEPLFRVQTRENGRTELSLPQLLGGLASSEITSFDALQPHQRQGWYCFLVQLAAIALARNGEQKLVTSASHWRELLLALTDENELPWCLVVDDVSHPAFMQSPIPEGSLEEAKYKADVITPDDLDILLTSKNHDVKMHRITHSRIEHWIYALITLQTMQGFFGVLNYGIVRMNKGHGNRPMVGMTSDLNWGPRFRRDVKVCLAARAGLAEQYNYNLDGIALLWLIPWDGSKSGGLPLDRCDPLFIEICRRIRFTYADGSLCCWRANTEATRIAGAKEFRGVTGDPWTPIDKENDLKALTIKQGFSYDKLHEILFTGKYAEPLALKTTAAEGDGAFVIATTLVRGKGETAGWHNRVIPVPSKAIRPLGSIPQRKKLAIRAQEQVDIASNVQRYILYPALRALLRAGSKEKREDKKKKKEYQRKLSRWTNAYDADVDDVFFQQLWDSLDLARDEARLCWQQQLFDFARHQLEDAINSTPLPSIRRYRAISAAESIFYGSIRKHPDKFVSKQQGKEEHDSVTNFQ
jgi:CRISPR system Cascade subunit CasA